jgi:hypothetical protein
VTAAGNTVSGFDHAWWIQAGAGLLAAASLLLLLQRQQPVKRKERIPCLSYR